MMVIGCSPSTGSSLLANILNRHSQILCGPETTLFARMGLMMNWDWSKRLLYKRSWRKLHDFGWHRYRGVAWNQEEYPWSESSFGSIVNNSNSYLDFISECESAIEPNLWIEKTPSNAYSFGWLRAQACNIDLLIMIRDPYDTIASLVARGNGVVYATGLYLLHTSAGYFASEPTIPVCRYESLVIEPEEEVKKILELMNLEFESSMLEAESRNIKMSGWNHDESGPIKNSSIGRFDALPTEIKEEIVHAVDALSINPDFRIPDQSWDILSVQEICKTFSYNFRKPQGVNKFRTKHRRILNIEKIKRTYKGYPTHLFNFPLVYHG